jgi:tetratricopeptide (TPR) repeat protein
MERQEPRVGDLSTPGRTVSRRVQVRFGWAPFGWAPFGWALCVAVVLARPATAGERSANGSSAAEFPSAEAPSPEAVALAVHGMAALGAGHYGEALKVFADAAAAHPSDATLCTGAGLAATMLGRQGVAIDWLEQALRLDGGQVEAARVLGELYYRTGRAPDAIALYERALVRRGSVQLAGRLDLWRREQALYARFTETRGEHFSVLSETSAHQDAALATLDRLEAAYRQIGAVLDVFPSTRVTVVLYTPEQFREVSRLPAWAGAAYDGRIRVPLDGVNVLPAQFDELLTHELVHAIVAMLAGPAVPAWLNEGLASVMEPGGAKGAAAVLARTAERLPLVALEERFSGLPEAMVPVAYAQSAHAVQRLIDLRGPQAVTSLLRALGEGEPFEAAFERRAGMSLDAFGALVAR